MDNTTEWRPLEAIIPAFGTSVSIVVAFIALSKKCNYPHLIFLVIAASAGVACRWSNSMTHDPWINEIFLRFLFIFLAHQSFLFNILSPSQLDEERRAWTSCVPSKYGNQLNRQPRRTDDGRGLDPSGRNWAFAYKMLFNPLCYGTKWEVPLRRRPSGGISGDRGALTKRKFVLRRLFVLMSRYVALCIYYHPAVLFKLPGGRVLREDYDPANPSFFRKQLPCMLAGYCKPWLGVGYTRSWRAGILRLHWAAEKIVPGYLALSSYHDMLAIGTVLIEGDQPAEWPAFYGNILDAYSVKNLWWLFWHRLVYRSFSAHAQYLCKTFFPLRNHNLARRYLTNAIVFALSGEIHRAIVRIMTPERCSRCGCDNSFWWYALQVFGLLLEAVVQGVYRYIERELFPEFRTTIERAVFVRVVGYVWVLCWLAWVTEQTDFPFIYCATARGPAN